MTMPHERTQSLVMAGGFLIELARNKELPLEVRQRAVIIARHFPTIEQLSFMAVEAPTGFELGLVDPSHVSDSAKRCRFGPLTYSTNLQWPEI